MYKTHKPVRYLQESSFEKPISWSYCMQIHIKSQLLFCTNNNLIFNKSLLFLVLWLHFIIFPDTSKNIRRQLRVISEGCTRVIWGLRTQIISIYLEHHKHEKPQNPHSFGLFPLFIMVGAQNTPLSHQPTFFGKNTFILYTKTP